MLRQVTLEDIEPISLGAGILGTGGGGDPYLGALHLREVMRKFGPAQIVDPFELDDDALVPMIGFIGALSATKSTFCHFLAISSA